MYSKEWYTVIAENNFYESMSGYKVGETPKSLILEFRLNKKLGGTQRVQFFKNQIEYDGKY